MAGFRVRATARRKECGRRFTPARWRCGMGAGKTAVVLALDLVGIERDGGGDRRRVPAAQWLERDALVIERFAHPQRAGGGLVPHAAYAFGRRAAGEVVRRYTGRLIADCDGRGGARAIGKLLRRA